jgi:hypothetical protein
MSIDTLRAHVLTVWIGALLLSCGMFAGAAAAHYAGLTFQDVKTPVRDLFAAVAPGLIALLGVYFGADLESVRLTRGQRRIVLVLTYIYVVSFVSISAAMLFVDGFGLNQDAAPPHSAVNHYVMMTHLQPLVIGPLFFLFGKSAGSQASAG